MRYWGWLVFAIMLVSLYMSLLGAPTAQLMGDVQRLMYVHIGSAWNAFIAFFVVFLAGVGYLWKGKEQWDRLALCSAEIGVLFTTLTIISGSVWARVAWGVWWDWKPRLTTTAILWFIYVGYLLIRSQVQSDVREGKLAAAFAIIGFIDVPIVYVSVSLWRGVHPTTVEMEPLMGLSIGVATLAFTLLYLWLLSFRVRQERLRSEIKRLKAEWQSIGG